MGVYGVFASSPGVGAGASFTPAYATIVRTVNTTNLGAADTTYRIVTTWDSQRDVSGITVSLAAGTLTIVTAGVYRVTFCGPPGYDASAVDDLFVRLVKNGVAISGLSWLVGEEVPVTIDTFETLAAADVLRIEIAANSAGRQVRSPQGTFSVLRVA